MSGNGDRQELCLDTASRLAEEHSLALTAGGAQALETKAAGSGDLERLLCEFTAEMRAQFELFRHLREMAGRLIEGADEAGAKQARADIKAATDAMSLIIRTLEKIDALLRQFERDRIEAEERQLLASDPDSLRRHVADLMAARISEAVASQQAGAVNGAVAAPLPGDAGGTGPPG